MYDVERSKKFRTLVNSWAMIHKGHGSIVAPPGTGKTQIGLLAGKLIRKSLPDSFNVLVGYSQPICTNWRNNDSEHVFDLYLSITEFMVQAKSLIEKAPTLIVFDEYHKYFSDAAFQTINTVPSKYRLGLYGLRGNKELQSKMEATLPVVAEITMTEALMNGWIMPVTELNVDIPLSDGEIKIYTNYSDKMSELAELFRNLPVRLRTKYPELHTTFDVINACLRDTRVTTTIDGESTSFILSPNDLIVEIQMLLGYNNKYVGNGNSAIKLIQELYSADNIKSACSQYMNLSRLRSTMLSDLYYKNELANYLLKNLKDVPKLIYCESIKACDRLANQFGNDPTVQRLHSKLESIPMMDDKGNRMYFGTGKPKMVSAIKRKEQILIDFQSGKITTLILANSLNEGFNKPDLRLIVNYTGTRDTIKYGQRKSRANRIDDSKAQPVVINMIMADIIYNNKEYPNYDRLKLLERQNSSNAINIDSDQWESIINLIQP